MNRQRQLFTGDRFVKRQQTIVVEQPIAGRAEDHHADGAELFRFINLLYRAGNVVEVGHPDPLQPLLAGKHVAEPAVIGMAHGAGVSGIAAQRIGEE